MKFDRKLEPWLAAGLITLVTALTYGILIPYLGFYRDDWYMLWAGQANGPAGIIKLFLTDRPLIGQTYALIFRVIGANVLAWQVYALLLKILTGLTLLWLLRLLWPTKRLETTFATLLYVLYPGFYQQPVAGTFNIDLLGLVAAHISIALSIYGVQSRNRLAQILCTLVAMALALFYIALYEATIGLEVVRWTLIWYVMARVERSAAQSKPDKTTGKFDRKQVISVSLSTLKALLPYLLTVAGFVFWRLFIFKSVRRATNLDALLADYARNPLYSLSQILFGYLKDLFETIVSAWFVPFYQFTANGRATDFLSGLGVTLLALALVAAYFVWARRQEPEPAPDDPLARHWLWIGLIGVAFPSAVIVLLGRNVLFSTQWDRYTTQSMLGVALVVLGAILYYLRGSARWAVLFGLLFLAVMTHYHSAAYHVRFWNYERSVIWQLSWRAPALQEGTTLIVSLPDGYHLAEEYEIWGPVNMAYYPGQPMQVSGQVPNDGLPVALTNKEVEKRVVRNVNVRRDYGKPLIISLPSGNSCVHVIDGQNPNLPFFEDGLIRQIAGFSNPGLIDPSAAPITPAAVTFGPEPEHGWCFYYQKIQLALQAGDWATAATLADESAAQSLKPSDETEWMPIVEAYARTAQPQKADSAIKAIDSDLRKYLCLQPMKDILRAAMCGGK